MVDCTPAGDKHRYYAVKVVVDRPPKCAICGKPSGFTIEVIHYGDYTFHAESQSLRRQPQLLRSFYRCESHLISAIPQRFRLIVRNLLKNGGTFVRELPPDYEKKPESLQDRAKQILSSL